MDSYTSTIRLATTDQSNSAARNLPCSVKSARRAGSESKLDTTSARSAEFSFSKVTIEPNSEIIVVHNAFDGREGVEWANEILNLQL